MRRVLSVLLLVLIVVQLGLRLYQYRENYFEKFDPEYWRQRYLKSQWVVSGSKEPIGDDGLYSWAGWEYVHGKDPTLLNPEIPPLGKYLIGFSILIFKNRNIFAVLVGILVLVAFYQLNFFLLKDIFWALVPTAFFSFEPLFINQLRAPFLDTLYLLFIILTFNFFLRKKYLSSAVFLGFAASTKGTISTFGLVFTTTIVFLALKKRDKIFSWILSLPFSFLVVLLSYGRYFLLGHSLREFLGVQKWILDFYITGAKGKLGMVFPMVLLNRWYTWWNGVVEVKAWRFSWPILLISPLFLFLFFIWRLKRLKSQVRIEEEGFIFLGLWFIVYLSFLSFIPVWPRYLLLSLPFEYIITTFLVREAVEYFKKRKN